MTLPISILIPCYNAETHLEECLQSALAQNAAEIILIDDASTDTSYAIALQYNDRIHVLKNAANLGGSATRNMLFGLSTQPWIQYLDADDKLLSGKLQGQFDQSAATDIVYGDFTIERWNGTVPLEEPWRMDPDLVKALILFENPGQTNIFLYRRTLLGQVSWDETALYQAGLIGHKYNLDLLQAGARFQHVPHNCCLYRRGWSASQATDTSKAKARMLTRLAFWDALKTWVQSHYGTQYNAEIVLLEKRLQLEKQRLGMGL
jgi:glycosyltransferase involved in cell wall biosynthesis